MSSFSLSNGQKDGLNPHLPAKAIELQASSTVYTSVRPPAAGGMPSFADTLQQTGDVVTRALKTSELPQPAAATRVSFLWLKMSVGEEVHQGEGGRSTN